MAGGTQPKDITSTGSLQNPPVFKTFSADPYGAQATAATANSSFFSANVYTTGSGTASNPNGDVRSFDFVVNQLVGSGGLGN